jgi:hypothetical protein
VPVFDANAFVPGTQPYSAPFFSRIKLHLCLKLFPFANPL